MSFSAQSRDRGWPGAGRNDRRDVRPRKWDARGHAGQLLDNRGVRKKPRYARCAKLSTYEPRLSRGREIEEGDQTTPLSMAFR